MQDLEELIRKFWANQTTLAENRRLVQLLEQYQVTIEQHVPEEEWEVGSGDGLQPDRALQILQRIHRRLLREEDAGQKKKPSTVRRLYLRLAVAASICLLAVSVFLLTDGRRQARTGIAAAPSSSPHLVNVANSSDSVLSVTLQDGSAVQLEKNSSLTYYNPFINDRRDISLRGIALFKVAKDRKRPFTVYAGGIATTALGTKFVVNTTDGRKVMVRLLEGKVVITTAAGSHLTMNDVYLSPGQEFSFDKASRQYVVNVTHDRVMETGKPEPRADKPDLVFRKEPLDHVFEKVGHLYRVPLSFRKEELKGLYFTGTFLKSDNLDIVLSTICNVNDLLVAKKGDTIIITKSH
jgi:ferric-dicitrate binding protein FerR (iron transport regulator)